MIGFLGGGSALRKVSTYTVQHSTGKRGHTTMSKVGLEPTIPVYECIESTRTIDQIQAVILGHRNIRKVGVYEVFVLVI
jgi:hypothetical protein